MATWSDFIDAEPTTLPRQVFLVAGESDSALVNDKVLKAAHGYENTVHLKEPSQLRYATLGVSNKTAYIVRDPDKSLIGEIVKILKSGSHESFFVLLSSPTLSKDDGIQFIKKKAQASKMYYTLSTPKTDSAQSKMESFFMRRWGMVRRQAEEVCEALGHSPSQLYLFDLQYRMLIGDSILSSSQADRIIHELLGSDRQSVLIGDVLNNIPIEETLTSEYNHQVLGFLVDAFSGAIRISEAREMGAFNASQIAKETGLTTFKVSQYLPLSEMKQKRILENGQKVIDSFYPYSDQKDMIQVLSRVL